MSGQAVSADAPADTRTRILIDDRAFCIPWTGVATFAAGIIAHWPDDAALHPEGFGFKGVQRDYWPTRGMLAARSGERVEPLQLQPLASWSPNVRRNGVRGLSLKRRVLLGVYHAAFRFAARAKRYAAAWEFNQLAMPTRLPTVTTLHDLSVLDHPQWHPINRVDDWRRRIDRAVKATTRWIVDARFTVGRMAKLLSVDAGDVEVIPGAARPLPYPSMDELPALREAANLPPRYFLALGTVEPRKNLSVLLDAWAAAPAALRESHRLIFAGACGWGDEGFWRRLLEHPMAAHVRVTGYISDAQAGLLLAGAEAVLMPSHYEGFGLPILEGMAAGAPVLCSDIPPFVEVAADAAQRLPVADARAWSDAMQRIVEDEPWRTHLRQAGPRRAAEFSWQETARRYAQVIEKVAAVHGG